MKDHYSVYGVMVWECVGKLVKVLLFADIQYQLSLVLTINQGSADKLFTLCAEFAADSTKKKVQIMPLQNTVLILCPVSFHCMKIYTSVHDYRTSTINPNPGGKPSLCL